MDSNHLAETLGRHDEKLDAILERVERVEMKVDYTNGRVRGLELFKARVIALGAIVLLLAPIYLPRIIG
jgi:hypothetical protein